MKTKILLLLTALLFMLCGCGRKDTAQRPEGEETPPQAQPPAGQHASESPADERKDITFRIEGEEETVRTLRHTGEGYSIYIPEEDWRFEREEDDGIIEERWESLRNDDVELTVRTYPVYPDASVETTKLAFLRESGYVFEDLTGGTPGDPLVGREADGDYLCFVAAEGAGGATYIVAWEYPAEAAEGFGVRLRVMADTFSAN